MPPNAHDFLVEVDAQINQAAAQARPYVEINAGELHRSVGGYPPPEGENHAMPNCCSVMWQEYDAATDEIVHSPPSRQGASLTIRYRLPRPHGTALMRKPAVKVRHGACPSETEYLEDGQ